METFDSDALCRISVIQQDFTDYLSYNVAIIDNYEVTNMNVTCRRP